MDKRFRNSSKEESIHKAQNIKIDNEVLKKIKVEITRRIPGNNETKELDHSLERPEEIKIYRCQGEGSRPIFDRNDVIVNKEETERRTVSAYSPHRSPSRQNSSYKSSDNYTSLGRNSPRCAPESPKRSSSRYSQSPRPKNKCSTSNRNSVSPYRDSNKPSTSRDIGSSSRNSSRNRSRSRESSRRYKRSRSRSSRREFGRRRNSRSPDNRDRRRYDRRYYGDTERDRRRDRSRSPRYARRRSRDRLPHNPHLPPIDPATVIPLIIPPFYGPEDAVWFPPTMRPPIFVPPGVHMPPRGMYRGPMPGMRFPLPGRPPYGPRQPAFRQVRPQNRPQLQ